jgi:putative two-component system response regulator
MGGSIMNQNLSSDLLESLIMVVDDEDVNLKLIKSMLELHGYKNFSLINNSQNVLNEYKKERPALILLDLNMPYIDGFGVLKQLYALEDELLPPVVMLTAQKGNGFLLKALELGARDYITKPFDMAELLGRVKTMLEVYLAHRLVFEKKNLLEDMVRTRTKELLDTRLQIIKRLSKASEFRDNETGNHIIRVSNTCKLIAQRLGWDRDKCDILEHAAPMHDVGKIGIPDEILLKPGRLDPKEFEIMKTHSSIGGSILGGDNSELLVTACELALSHHEKWDGTGYPNGLKGEDIPISGRIVAIADVFDALTSKRPYKKPWPVEEAVDYIRNNSGIQFDPHLVDIFEELLPQIIEKNQKYADFFGEDSE